MLTCEGVMWKYTSHGVLLCVILWRVLNNGGVSLLADGWLSHSEQWQEVRACSFLIYHCTPEFVHVLWGGGWEGGLLMASHSLLWQTIIEGGLGGLIVHFVYNLMLGVKSRCTEKRKEVLFLISNSWSVCCPLTALGAAHFTGLLNLSQTDQWNEPSKAHISVLIWPRGATGQHAAPLSTAAPHFSSKHFF